MEEKVILVNEMNQELGHEEKMKAHLTGLLHRAISVFIFNSKGELLLQRRALEKYHSGGLWTNTCCSHPRPGEDSFNAAKRRLKEEMGLEADLKEIFSFIYQAKLDKGLFEYEYDKVFVGFLDKNPIVDSAEIMDWKWIKIDELREDLLKNSKNYSYWFKKIIERVLEKV